MKKNIIMAFMAVMVSLTSCSNDEIEIGQATTFKINPSNVIGVYTAEYVPGELEAFSTGFKLRTRLLVYNDKGVLQEQQTQYLNNYASVANVSAYLPDGSYTAVAMTDVVEGGADGVSFEYWTLSGEGKLSETTITDQGYIGGKNKILGMTSSRFTVSSGVSKDVNLNVQSVGTLFYLTWYRVHQYEEVSRYKLLMNKTSEKIVLNESGSYDVSVENNGGSYDWRLAYLDPEDETYTNIYGYYFTLPMNNIAYKFVAETASSNVDLGAFTVNAQAGQEYIIWLDLCDPDSDGQITYYCGLANGAVTQPAKTKAIETVEAASNTYLLKTLLP